MYYLLAVGMAFFLAWIFYENANPIKDKYEIIANFSERIDKLTILHISDLHNYCFGHKQEKLLKLVAKDYDYVFITGDLIDRRYPNIDIAMDLIEGLKAKGQKIIFIKGNHEKGSDKYSQLEERLRKNAVNILNDSSFLHEDIRILGMEDPAEYRTLRTRTGKDEKEDMDTRLSKLLAGTDESYKILLSHRPELFDLYVKHGLDLVFSGHAHGGQMRIFSRGLFAPDQGFFAKYAGGIFTMGKTTMVNSRGLGSNFPFVKRIFNRPHITEVVISKK